MRNRPQPQSHVSCSGRLMLRYLSTSRRIERPKIHRIKVKTIAKIKPAAVKTSKIN